MRRFIWRLRFAWLARTEPDIGFLYGFTMSGFDFYDRYFRAGRSAYDALNEDWATSNAVAE